MLLPRAIGFCLLASLVVVVRAATQYSVPDNQAIACADALDSVCHVPMSCYANGQVEIVAARGNRVNLGGTSQSDGIVTIRGGYTITFLGYSSSTCEITCQGDCACTLCSSVEVADFDTSTMTTDADDDDKPNALVISLISVASVSMVAMAIMYFLGRQRHQRRNQANVAPATMDDENNDDDDMSNDDDSIVEPVDALAEDDRPSQRDARAVVGRIGRPFCKSGGNAWKWLSLGLACVVIVLVVLFSTSTKAKKDECSQDAGCGGNLTCGLSEADANAPLMCCLHGGLHGAQVSGTLRNGEFAAVCANRPVGTYCHKIDIMCSSNLCIHSICASDLLADRDPCNKDADCKSNKCVRSSAEPDWSMICCSETVQLDYGRSVCTSLPTGSRCDDLDHACASGVCINGVCAD